MIKKQKPSTFFTLLCTFALFNAEGAYAFSGDKLEQTNSNLTIEINAESKAGKAQDFVTSLSQEGIAFLQKKEISEQQKQKKFKTFLKQNFDLKTIGRFVLGRYWRQSTKAQKKEYLELFENMVIDVYTRRFSEYDGQNIEITKARPQGKSDIILSLIHI